MLTGSSNSYLGQDYLQPLPTTLDAKNSPLALLAATCNNIGKDDSAKSIIPPIERKDRRDRDSNQPLSPDKGSLHDRKGSPSAESGRKSNRSGSPRSHIDMSSPLKKDLSLDRNRSPLRHRSVSPRSPHRHSHSSSSDIKSNNNIASKISLNCGSLSVEINHKESSHHHGSSSSGHSNSHHRSPNGRTSSPGGLLPPSSSHSGSLPPSHHTGLLSTYYPHLGLPGYPMLPGSNPLLAAHHKLASSDSQGHTPVTYATVKTASGSPTLVPVCADPFCVQCKLAMQSAQLGSTSPCPAGCTQCSRDKLHHTPHGLTSASASLPSLAGLTHGLGGSSAAAIAAAALYGGHSSALIGNPLSSSSTSSPALVCNWVGGGKYCGERFSSSEELMTHLRSHTSSLEQSSLHAASLAAASSPYAGLTHPALASLSHLYPSSLSPNSSLRSVAAAAAGGSLSSRSLSPSSILSSSSRFHPYLKSPLQGLGSTFPPTSIHGVHPSLGPFPSSLYALTGTRLGPLVP